MDIYDDLTGMGLDFFIGTEEITTTPCHAHWYLELAYVLDGRANHQWNGIDGVVSVGDFFVVGHLSQHSYVAVSSKLKIINVKFNPVFFEPSLSSAKSFFEVLGSNIINLDINLFLEQPTPRVFRDESGVVKQLLMQMLGEFQKKDPGYLEMIRALFTQIIILSMRSIYVGIPSKGKTDTFAKVIQYINYNYMHHITLKDICEISNYTVPHMSKKFKSEVGLSFSEYLKQVRIMTSQRLLINSEKSIDRIMEEVGYQDKRSFYGAFREVSGTTPYVYKRKHRKAVKE